MPDITQETKKELIEQLIAKLEKSLASSQAELKHKTETRNQAGGAMISRYDTFKEEAEYAANALARSVDSLNNDIGRLRSLLQNGLAPGETIRLGSVVTVDAPTGPEFFFFVPAAAGVELYPEELEGEELTAVTPASPLGQVFIGKPVGFETEFRGRKLRVEKIY